MPALAALLLASQVAASPPPLGRHPLNDAIVEGRAAAVTRLIAAGANLEEPDDTGMTALMVAAAQGQTAIAKLLIAARARVDAADRDGITPLMRAAAANRLDTVTLLLASGADPNIKMRDGATALTAAAFGGYADVVKQLLDRHVDPSPADQQGRTPLMAAAMNGHAAVAAALLANGANVKAADAGGATAMRYAAARGNADVVEMLLKAGAVWSVDELRMAAEGCHAALMALLLKQGADPDTAVDGRPLLAMAAAGGCVDTVGPLAGAGAKIDAADQNGRTALMEAAAAGSREVVKLLLDKGANRRAMDNLERTPAMFAALSRSDEVIALLSDPQPAEAGSSAIRVESPMLKADQPIPKDYTADGQNVSPPLSWSNLPGGTRQIAVVCEDPDAGNPPPFVHWVIYKIPATAKGLPENIPFEPDAPMPPEIGGAIQGVSGFRRPIYRGPAPPPGKVHHYHFVVYAIDSDLDLKPGLTRADLLAAIQGHVIGQGELVATYERK